MNNIRVWGGATKGIDCGEEISQWFSSFLSKPNVRLAQHIDALRAMRSGLRESGKKLIADNKGKVSNQIANRISKLIMFFFS